MTSLANVVIAFEAKRPVRTLVLSTYKPLDYNGRGPDTDTPNYPKFGATVARYRKLPPTPENVKAHAAALFSQLASIQRAEFRKSTVEPEPRPSCISGTWHTDGGLHHQGYP